VDVGAFSNPFQTGSGRSKPAYARMTCQRIKRVHRLPAPIPIAALLGHNPVDSADQLPESGETQDDTGRDAMSEQVALTVARRDSSFPTE
jgi:hypothetical protein